MVYYVPLQYLAYYPSLATLRSAAALIATVLAVDVFKLQNKNTETQYFV